VEDIELKDFKLQVSDKPLTTHVAVAGSTAGMDTVAGFPEWVESQGIITVEDTRVMQLLLGFSPETEGVRTNSWEFLQTFGMRPLRQEASFIRSHYWEILYGLFVFMKQWTMQYQSPVELTFMPELYPGMRIALPESERHSPLEVYVESVSHSGSRTGGYSTSVTVSCPVRNGIPLELEIRGSQTSLGDEIAVLPDQPTTGDRVVRE